MEAEATKTAFDQALSDFRASLRRDGLKKKDEEIFSQTTQESLLTELTEIQNEQHAKRRGMNLARLRPFIEAMDQLGKVIEVFVNAHNYVAFIWGPMKLILQIAGAFSDAFNDLLDMYESIGESFHLLTQSEQLFRNDSHMLRLLILMYKDIFEFHRRALKYFRQPCESTSMKDPQICHPAHGWHKVLKQLFQATWKTYKSRFTPLIDQIHGHGELIHRQATLSQIRQFQQARYEEEVDRRLRRKDEQANQLRALCDWLRSPNMENHQYHLSKIREQYPGTGSWLLDEPLFKEWFDPKFYSVPTLLWVNGMPGAGMHALRYSSRVQASAWEESLSHLGSGKTILASLVIEAAKALSSPPTVLFFYCKNGDKEKNNFDSIGRAFLVQLLKGNKDILMPYYYDDFSISTDTTLSTHTLIERLLRVSILNCPNVYIILDGIDECERSERKKITEWFRSLVEGSTKSESDPVRCMFISQDDGIARKDFSGVTTLKIESKHNSADIETYCEASAKAIQEKFELDDCEKDNIAKKVHDTAKGMFLLAKLIINNLINQTSQEDLELELEDGTMPKELEKAYSRIVSRVLEKALPRERQASQKLLDWLVCAKRPLKWHEIQAAKSFHMETQIVDLKRYAFRVSSKDLCGSLVEIWPDGTVEFVHSTAKTFLLKEHVNVRPAELSLTSLCLSYLNMPGFSGREDRDQLTERIPTGYFAFMDYSIGYWLRHLEAGLADGVTEDEEVIEDLAECLSTFLDLHFQPPVTTQGIQTNQGSIRKLQPFRNMSFYSHLKVAVTSTRRQLTFGGDIKPGEIALNLADIAVKIRNILEEVFDLEQDDKRKAKLQEIYGEKIFKCPKPSCRAFYDGFSTAKERDVHVNKHDRPYRCTVANCPQRDFGFSTQGQLTKHTEKTHGVRGHDELVFPSETEISATQETNNDQRDRRDQRHRRYQRTSTQEAAASGPQEQKSGEMQQSLENQGKQKLEKRPACTEFPCPHCSKVFRRKYNLQSHMVTHSSSRPYSCEYCALSFARKGDLVRHKTSHGPKEFMCGGFLQTGESWGCGSTFARADMLKAHHETKVGQECLRLMLQEQSHDEVA